jgi:RimJ/RimL family protein N-acetyltransferase
MERVVYEEDVRVGAWLDAQMGYSNGAVKASIGYERDGELVAGVVFDNGTDNNVFAHIASTAEDGVPLDLLRACYVYAFVQLGLQRVSLLVREDNLRCLHFIHKWGATLECRLARATKACDQLIYVLWRNAELDQIMLARRT